MKEKIKNVLIIVQAILIISSFSYFVSAATTTKATSVYYAKGAKTVNSALTELNGIKDEISLVGDAEADHIVEGKSLYVKGQLVEGEMLNFSGQTVYGE